MHNNCLDFLGYVLSEKSKGLNLANRIQYSYHNIVQSWKKFESRPQSKWQPLARFFKTRADEVKYIHNVFKDEKRTRYQYKKIIKEYAAIIRDERTEDGNWAREYDSKRSYIKKDDLKIISAIKNSHQRNVFGSIGDSWTSKDPSYDIVNYHAYCYPIPKNLRQEVLKSLEVLVPGGIETFESMEKNGWFDLGIHHEVIMKGVCDPLVAQGAVLGYNPVKGTVIGKYAGQFKLPRKVQEGIRALWKDLFGPGWVRIEDVDWSDAKVKKFAPKGGYDINMLSKISSFTIQPIVISPCYANLVEETWDRTELPLQVIGWVESAFSGFEARTYAKIFADYAKIFADITAYFTGYMYGADIEKQAGVKQALFTLNQLIYLGASVADVIKTGTPTAVAIKFVQVSQAYLPMIYKNFISSAKPDNILTGHKWYALPIGRSYLAQMPPILLLRIRATCANTGSMDKGYFRIKSVIEDYLYAPDQKLAKKMTEKKVDLESAPTPVYYTHYYRPDLDELVNLSDKTTWDINKKDWVRIKVDQGAIGAVGGEKLAIESFRKGFMLELSPKTLSIGLIPEGIKPQELIDAKVVITNPMAPGKTFNVSIQKSPDTGQVSNGEAIYLPEDVTGNILWVDGSKGQINLDVSELFKDRYGRPLRSQEYAITLHMPQNKDGSPGEIKQGKAIFLENAKLPSETKLFEKGLWTPVKYGIQEMIHYYDAAKTKKLEAYAVSSPPGDTNGRFHREVRHGYYKAWYETGELKIEGQFTKDKPSGKWKEYFKDSSVKGEFLLDELGNNIGKRYSLYNDGTIHYEENYNEKGERHGKFFIQTKDHVVIEDAEFKNGKVVSGCLAARRHRNLKGQIKEYDVECYKNKVKYKKIVYKLISGKYVKDRIYNLDKSGKYHGKVLRRQQDGTMVVKYYSHGKRLKK